MCYMRDRHHMKNSSLSFPSIRHHQAATHKMRDPQSNWDMEKYSESLQSGYVTLIKWYVLVILITLAAGISCQSFLMWILTTSLQRLIKVDGNDTHHNIKRITTTYYYILLRSHLSETTHNPSWTSECPHVRFSNFFLLSFLTKLSIKDGFRNTQSTWGCLKVS